MGDDKKSPPVCRNVYTEPESLMSGVFRHTRDAANILNNSFDYQVVKKAMEQFLTYLTTGALLGSSVSCTSTDDAYGNPSQTVTPAGLQRAQQWWD